MKKQKLVKALAVFTMSAIAAAGCVSLVGCKTKDKNGNTHEHTYSDSWTSDGSGHWHVATCGHEEETSDYGTHEYSSATDGECDVCGYVRHDVNTAKVIYAADGHYNPCKYDGCGEKYNLVPHDFDTTKTLVGFEGHYNPCKTEACNIHGNVTPHHFDEETKICSDCGQLYVSSEFLPSELEATTYTDGYSDGFFTILPGTTVRTRSRENYNVYDHKDGAGDSTSAPIATGFTAHKSVQYNGSAKGFSVKAPAPGRLTVYLDNGSGGKTKADKQTVVLTKPDGTTQVISYYCGDMYAVTINCDKAGVYKITRGDTPGVGTTDVYYAKFETVVPVTPVESIEITNKGKVEYIKGETFDYSKLQVETVHEETGVRLPLDLSDPNVTVDYSAFDGNVAGEYKITVSYTVDEKTFKDDYTVVVYDVEALELGFNKIVQGSNTSAGNGQYINKTVKQFYFKDEELNLDGLTVKTVLDNGNQKFIVTEGFTVTGFVKGQEGKQTVRVSWTDNTAIYKEFDVYVVGYTAASVSATNNELTINVNKDVTDAQIGVLENGAYQFKTIQQSLDFLNALGLDKNVKKVINLGEGTYTERLEITVPNLTIKGADHEDATKTVIEWDSLVGIADESGFIHITDSTATLNVRDTAIGFVIEDVTISNWYNSEAHFTEKFGAGYGEHRALAALIQADKVVIDNCRLLGYQDTIELFTGRQLIQNSYICGRTDFIFGTNNTTYFKNCEIESIVDGGYVTAFKGNNKGDNDWVQYGAIFDGCNFTAPQAVIDKKDTSLGRTWAKYAAVAYVNCNFAGHISTTPYSSAKGTRYTAMSGAEPTNDTVKFVEYNNTGAGAVDHTIAGMTYLTAEQAANYSNMQVFFGKTNGKVTYADTWDGSKGVEITIFDYKFSGYYNAEDSYTYHEIPEGGEEILGGLATVTGTKWGHELDQSKDHAKFDKGCVIQLKEAGEVTVTTYGSHYGDPENIKIVYINGVATIYIVATEAEPINNGCYITLIQLNKEEVPAHAHDFGAWQVTETPTETNPGLAVKTCQHCESDPAHSVQETLPALSQTDYTIGAGTTAGNSKYTYTTEGGETIEFETTTLSGLHVHDYGAWVYNESESKVVKTCTGEGECDALNVEVPVPALTDSGYTITNNTATLDAAGTGTYTIEISGEKISFTAPTPQLSAITTTTVYNFRQVIKEGVAAGETKAINNMEVHGAFNDNGGQWYIVGVNTTLSIKVNSNAKVTYYTYDAVTYDVKVGDADAQTVSGTKETSGSYNGCFGYSVDVSADDTVVVFTASNTQKTTYIGYIVIEYAD